MKEHGVFIPAFIWRLNIKCDMKCLLAHIYYFHKTFGKCTTPNNVLSNEMGVSVGKIMSMIKELDKLNYIYIERKTYCSPMWSEDQTPIATRCLTIHEGIGVDIWEDNLCK